MSTAPPVTRICPVCEQPLDSQATQCQHCSAGDDWFEMGEAYGFVRRRLSDWHDAGRLTTAQWGRLSDYYDKIRDQMKATVRQGEPPWTGVGYPPKDQCWSCREYQQAPGSRCEVCGVIQQSPGVRSLRAWKLLSRELEKHQEEGRLSLHQAHDFDAEVRERMAALRGRLEQDRVRPLEAAPTAKPPKVVLPRRSLLEILLDPQTIQWLLASGGALLVIGIVIWLASLGLFENPHVIAVALGLGNGLVLAGGYALLTKTRYQLAGRALMLLACLLMPLNLWFYHANKLILLEQHLWVAALVCCAIYAAAALTLRDHLFVYVLCAGLALTGLLLLGDLGRFDEILAPSALLVILGLAALHLERAFPEGEGPFTRQRFGLAFFWSAQALLGAGLLLLLGGQLTGWLPLWNALAIQRPLVIKDEYLSWTIAITLAGTYAYLWSDFAVRRVGVYIHLAAFTLLWSELQLLALLNVVENGPVVIITLALTALAVNVMQATLGKEQSFTRAVPALGLALSLVPVVYGVLLHFRETNLILHNAWPFKIDWPHVGAMVVTALICRVGAYLYRHTAPRLSAAYFFATAAATLVAAAGLAWMIDFKLWEMQAPLLMLIPIAYIVAARLYRGHSPEEPLEWVAHVSTIVMLISTLYAALELTQQVALALGVQPIVGATKNLLHALFCAEATIFYGLAAAFRKQSWNVYLATLMFCGTLWQLLSYWHTPAEYYTVIFAVAGIALLVVYRFAVLESNNWSGLATAAFQSANGLLSLGFLAGVLVTLSRLLVDNTALARLPGVTEWQQAIRTMIFVLILLGVLSLVACMLVRHSGWRRFYLVLAIVDAVLVFACFQRISTLSPWQKLEIFSLVIGAGLLVLGHIGWYRENERQNDLVGFCLFLGSMLATAPLFIAAMVYRTGPEPSAVNEVGLIISGIVLLGLGIVCRVKASTLVGGAALVAEILIVIVSLHRHLNQSVIIGIYLTAGGGLLFGFGLVLSLYRDRLLALPEKIKRREGLFKILNWR